MKKKSLNEAFILWLLWPSLIFKKCCLLMLYLGSKSLSLPRIKTLTWGLEENHGPRSSKILIVECLIFPLFGLFTLMQVVCSSCGWCRIKAYTFIIVLVVLCHHRIFMLTGILEAGWSLLLTWVILMHGNPTRPRNQVPLNLLTLPY